MAPPVALEAPPELPVPPAPVAIAVPPPAPLPAAFSRGPELLVHDPGPPRPSVPLFLAQRRFLL